MLSVCTWAQAPNVFFNNVSWNNVQQFCFKFTDLVGSVLVQIMLSTELAMGHGWKVWWLICEQQICVISSPYIMAFRPKVTHICVSKTYQHWFRLWLVAYLAPTHYLNQCWQIANQSPRNIFQLHIIQNSKYSSKKSALEKIICEMATLFFLAPMC